MRTAFVRSLEDIFEEMPEALLITGDLGFGVLDVLMQRFPDRVLNVGVAEQNMAGVATTLSLSGHVVFTYSIANFPTIRCLEQIRNDICYHRANVKVVAIGGGMAYGALGPSHFATEDIAIMGALPEMRVIAPGDPVETERLVPLIARTPGPVYLRLGRAGEARVIPDTASVSWFLPTTLSSGNDVLLLTTGGILPVGLRAAETLEQQGVSVGFASVHTVRPFPARWLAEQIGAAKLVVTCEEHSIEGGLGSAVAEVLAERCPSVHLRRFGLPRAFPKGIGSQEFLLRENGLTAERLVELVIDFLDGHERPGP